MVGLKRSLPQSQEYKEHDHYQEHQSLCHRAVGSKEDRDKSNEHLAIHHQNLPHVGPLSVAFVEEAVLLLD